MRDDDGSGRQRARDRYAMMVREHAPEAPPLPWKCPACGQLLPAGVAYCTHPTRRDP